MSRQNHHHTKHTKHTNTQTHTRTPPSPPLLLLPPPSHTQHHHNREHSLASVPLFWVTCGRDDGQRTSLHWWRGQASSRSRGRRGATAACGAPQETSYRRSPRRLWPVRQAKLWTPPLSPSSLPPRSSRRRTRGREGRERSLWRTAEASEQAHPALAFAREVSKRKRLKRRKEPASFSQSSCSARAPRTWQPAHFSLLLPAWQRIHVHASILEAFLTYFRIFYVKVNIRSGNLDIFSTSSWYVQPLAR